MQILTVLDKHKRRLAYLLLLILSLVVSFLAASYVKIESYKKYMYTDTETMVTTNGPIPVSIVFGGGISESGQPRPLLKERLDTARKLAENPAVKKIIVSGDNRYFDYNEPQAMKEYLISSGVAADRIQPDFAGRSTYETCERAAKVFGVKKAILVTEATHLPRAIFLCRQFGIEAYGLISSGQTAESLQKSQGIREILARGKAIINMYFIGERTILGEPIDLGL